MPDGCGVPGEWPLLSGPWFLSVTSNNQSATWRVTESCLGYKVQPQGASPASSMPWTR